MIPSYSRNISADLSLSRNDARGRPLRDIAIGSTLFLARFTANVPVHTESVDSDVVVMQD